MSIAIGLAVVIVIIFFIAASSGSSSEESSAGENKESAPKDAASPAPKKEQTVEEIKSKAVKEAREKIIAGGEGEVKDLCSLSLLSLGSFAGYDEMMEIIKTDCDPRLRLVVCYLFLEQLSPAYAAESSSAGLFAFKFYSAELSPEEFKLNWSLSPEEYSQDQDFYDMEFGSDAVWMLSINQVISRGCASFPSRKEAGGLFAKECANLVSKIQDKGLIQRFAVLAEEVLTESGLMSPAARGVLISLEL
jgi:hypothetical protein